MVLHDDLLTLARSMVPEYRPPYPPTPAEANLRRGVSTAYYALYHLLVGEAMTRIVADPALRPRVARSFDHTKMKLEDGRVLDLAPLPGRRRVGGRTPVGADDAVLVRVES